MKSWGESPFAAHLPPETVLSQMEMAVIVCDRFSNVIYGNAFARQLFGFGGDDIIGHSILSLGIAEEDHDTEHERQVECGDEQACRGETAQRHACPSARDEGDEDDD